MRIVHTFYLLLAGILFMVAAPRLPAMGQSSAKGAAPASSQSAKSQKVPTSHPVKHDTADTQKNRLMQYSRDSVNNIIFPLKGNSNPNSQEAERLFKEGSQKARNDDYRGAITDFGACGKRKYVYEEGLCIPHD
jgi:hypothetical protein